MKSRIADRAAIQIEWFLCISAIVAIGLVFFVTASIHEYMIEDLPNLVYVYVPFMIIAWGIGIPLILYPVLHHIYQQLDFSETSKIAAAALERECNESQLDQERQDLKMEEEKNAACPLYAMGLAMAAVGFGVAVAMYVIHKIPVNEFVYLAVLWAVYGSIGLVLAIVGIVNIFRGLDTMQKIAPEGDGPQLDVVV